MKRCKYSRKVAENVAFPNPPQLLVALEVAANVAAGQQAGLAIRPNMQAVKSRGILKGSLAEASFFYA
jgi:hypothetical protein